MKNKFIAIILSAILLISASACNNTEKEASETKQTETVADEHAGHNHAQDTSISEDQYTVELTLPSDYIGDTTQEELSQTAQELGYKSITLNEDGSATYIMTEEQHETMLDDIRSDLKRSVNEMVGSESYPSFSSVTVNDDFTQFMITTISTEYGSEENMAVMTLLMASGIYHIFKGIPAENVHIDVINLDSNDLIYSYDSSEGELFYE